MIGKIRLKRAIFVFICIFLFFSCENPYYANLLKSTLDQLAEVYFTITFDSRGGSEVPSQQVLEGNAIERPADPIRDGFLFTNWHEDAAATAVWDFARIPEADMTLYAGWRPLPFKLTPFGPHNFGSKNYGYAAGDFTPLSVAVENVSEDETFDVTVSISDTGSFSLSPVSFTNFAPGDIENFTVAPVEGKLPGTYTATVTVTGGEISLEFEVSYTVVIPQGEVTLFIDIDPITDRANITFDDATGAAGYNGTFYYINDPLSIAANHTRTITATPPSGATVRWEVQGVGVYSNDVVSGNGNSFVIKATLNETDEHIKYAVTGYHWLRMFVTAGGREYMINIRFQIVP